MLPLSMEDVQDNLGSNGRVFSQTQMNIICPWHGMEFDIRTGLHPTNARIRLRKIPARRDGDDIWLDLSAIQQRKAS